MYHIDRQEPKGVRTAVFAPAALKAFSYRRILRSTLVNEFPHMLKSTGITRTGDMQMIGTDSSGQFSTIMVLEDRPKIAATLSPRPHHVDMT
jgi:hypothetical protein